MGDDDKDFRADGITEVTGGRLQLGIRDIARAISTVLASSILLLWSPAVQAQESAPLSASPSAPPSAPVSGGRIADGHQIPTPVQPNSPSPLQPLTASPAGPDAGTSRPQPPAIFAQTPSALQESVLGRSRPEFQPQGIELDRLLSAVGLGAVGLGGDRSADKRSPVLSSFVVSPRVEVDVVHDSNLFREADATSDRITVVKPAIEIRSDWSSHALSVAINSKIGRHQKNSTEDYEDIGGRIAGSAEFFDSTKISAGVGLERTHSQRGEILDPGTTSGPALSYLTSVRLGVEHRIEPLNLRLIYTGSDVDFESSGTTDNDDLDRVDGRVAFRVGLEIDQGTSLFVEPSYNWRTFDRSVDSAGFQQDNDGIELLAGVTWDVSSVTFLEFALGYLRQEFDDPALSTIQGPSVSARMIWNPSDLWTVTLNSGRTVQETATPGQAGVLVTATDARIDYEFLYNTIVSVSTAYADEENSGSNQTDTRTNFGLRIRHLMNENLYVQFETNLIDLSSTDPQSEFDAFNSLVRLGVNM